MTHRRSKIPKGSISIGDYIKSLDESQKRHLRRARWRMKHQLATYGWKAQAFKDKMWCRSAGGCPRSLKRRNSPRTIQRTLHG